jgi:hypothetical protein
MLSISGVHTPTGNFTFVGGENGRNKSSIVLKTVRPLVTFAGG